MRGRTDGWVLGGHSRGLDAVQYSTSGRYS